MTPRWLGSVTVAAALFACGDEPAGPSQHDCDAVLTHLIVLEGERAGGPLCKYDPACDGAEHRRFQQRCPRVVDRREARCLLEATTLASADACLSRDELDERIERGRRSSRRGGDDDWLDRAGVTPRQRRILRALRRYADDACACTSPGCSDRVRDDFMRWAETMDKDDAELKPLEEKAMRTVERMFECLTRAGSSDPPDAWGYQPPPDAAPPDLGSYTGVAACDAYRDLIERYLACGAVPLAIKDATRDGYGYLRDAWGAPSGLSPAAREAMTETCQAASDAIRQSADQLGCPL
jgi:hypothetical protein